MAKAIIVIEDIDLADGTVRSEITVEGTQLDDGYVTAAHFFANHIKDCMRDPAFLAAVWAKAEAMIAENACATIGNPDQKIVAPANDTATEEAA